MHGETHGGGQVVPSLMVVENGAIGFACTFFYSGDIAAASMERGRKPQQMRATALAKRGWCHMSTVMGRKQVKVWWLVWCRVWPTLMVGRLLDVILYYAW